jgi:hypothetical protein
MTTAEAVNKRPARNHNTVSEPHTVPPPSEGSIRRTQILAGLVNEYHTAA